MASALRDLLAGLCGLLFMGVASAQGTASEAELRSIDAGRRQQERDQDQRQRLLSAPEVRLQPAAATSPRLPCDESPCFRIQAIDLIGPGTDIATSGVLPTELPPGWENWLLDTLDAGPTQDIAGQSISPRPDADSPLYQRSGVCVGSRGIAILQQRAQAALLARGYRMDLLRL